MRRRAPHEAVGLLGRSLTLLKDLPDSPARAQHELALLVAIGVPMLMTKGYAAEEVERTYARAHELCAQLGESPQLLPALAGSGEVLITAVVEGLVEGSDLCFETRGESELKGIGTRRVSALG
jgi:hypothetical protein